MKTKLLKKVRERFSITYYPKGTKLDYMYNTPLIHVYDNKTKVNLAVIHIGLNGENNGYNLFTLEDAKILARKELVWAIRRIYNKYGTRRIKQAKIKEAKEKVEYERETAKLELEQRLATEKLWYKK